MDIINMFFPEQLLIIFFMFIAVFALGGLGFGLVRLAQPSFAVSAIAVAMMALVSSYIGYTITIDLTVKQVAVAYETPTLASSQELVYMYGSDTPITRAEHERQLAYSAQHSTGDPE